MLGHVERITPSTPRIRFQLSRTLILARVGPHTQLVSQVLGDPLCQLDWKKPQKGVVPAAGILENLIVPLVAPSCSKDLLLQQHNVQGSYRLPQQPGKDELNYIMMLRLIMSFI